MNNINLSEELIRGIGIGVIATLVVGLCVGLIVWPWVCSRLEAPAAFFKGLFYESLNMFVGEWAQFDDNKELLLQLYREARMPSFRYSNARGQACVVRNMSDLKDFLDEFHVRSRLRLGGDSSVQSNQHGFIVEEIFIEDALNIEGTRGSAQLLAELRNKAEQISTGALMVGGHFSS